MMQQEPPEFGTQWADAPAHYDHIDKCWITESPIEYCMKKIGDNDGWMNFLKVIPYFDQTAIFWLIGARRLGKTDVGLRLICELWHRFGLVTMWMRNKDVEFDKKFFSNFLADAVKFGWASEDWDIDNAGVWTSKDRNNRDKIVDFRAISTFGNGRGGGHPKTILIWLDEFMPEDKKYPQTPAKGLMSTTQTVFAGNDKARVICTSNFTEGSNPYFSRYRIYPGKDDITLCAGANLIERCRGYKRAIPKAGVWAENYRQGGYDDYADEDVDPMLTMIAKPPKGAKPGPWILYTNGHHYRYFTKDGRMYWTYHNAPTKDIVVYADALRDTGDKVQIIPTWLTAQLKEAYGFGQFRFTEPNVLFDVMNVLYEGV